MKKLLLLHAAVLLSFSLFSQSGPDPIISEYVEGWSTNKAIELYNPTDTAIDLSNYRITRYSNGDKAPPPKEQWYVKLNVMLLPYETRVYVLDKRDPEAQGQDAPVWDALQARADTFVCPVYTESYALYFNGDDVVALEKMDGSMIDIFGKIGERPIDPEGGTGGWTDTDPFADGKGVILSRDHTLVRKANILKGVSTSVDKFNILAEWDSLPANTFTSLGWHDCSTSPDTNQKPAFDADSYAFDIKIDDPTGTSAGTVSATDPNGDELSYYITAGNSYDPFKINRSTGEIQVAKTEELYWQDYTLTIDVTDGTSPVSKTVDITVEGGYTGIQNLSHSVDIYPNPVVNGFIQINATAGIAGIEVYNLTGKRVMSLLNEGGSPRINVPLENVEAGVYMLKLRFSDDTMTARKILVR